MKVRAMFCRETPEYAAAAPMGQVPNHRRGAEIPHGAVKVEDEINV